MNTGSLVSIVVPLFNERQHVSALVANLVRLGDGFEAILVDASDDPKSREIAAGIVRGLPVGFPIKLVIAEQPGRALQMNLGAELAKGKIVLFLHCDTRLPENAVRLVSEKVGNGVHWGRFDVNLESGGLVYRLIEFMLRLRSRFRRLATGDQAIFVSTALFRACGGFPSIALMEDIALCRALNRHSKPLLITEPVTTSARRWENSGVFSTILLMWKLRFLYWIGVDPDKLAAMYGHAR